jgi:2-polyprenyl-6-hydroxyphenyl methylase / 3-demethylubiquinone-9 3-methyltransferase
MSQNTINLEEVKKFSDIAQEWWDESGKFKPLHKFNPIRIEFVKNKIIENFQVSDQNLPLKNIEIADIGCGGGLICEPLAKMGAKITGIDASEENIEVAKLHAKESGLNINYQNIDIEDFSKKTKKFDVVLALEVVEHVDNIEDFIGFLTKCLKKDGILLIATLNKTISSYLKAIIGAEYILKWLPIGTHDWKKFLKPSQINDMVLDSGDFTLLEEKGFDYDVFDDKWKLIDNLDVNYIMLFKKDA